MIPWTIENSPGQNTGVGSHSLLQGIFPMHGLNGVSCIAGGFFTSWAIREQPWTRHKWIKGASSPWTLKLHFHKMFVCHTILFFIWFFLMNFEKPFLVFRTLRKSKNKYTDSRPALVQGHYLANSCSNFLSSKKLNTIFSVRLDFWKTEVLYAFVCLFGKAL